MCEPANERFAEAFALNFLMPAGSVRQRFNDVVSTSGDFQVADLRRMSHFYFVSLEAMTLRMEQLGLVPQGTWVMIKEAGFSPAKAAELLGPAAHPESGDPYPERYKYLAVRAFEQEKISQGQLARFLRCDPVSWAGDRASVPEQSRVGAGWGPQSVVQPSFSDRCCLTLRRETICDGRRGAGRVLPDQSARRGEEIGPRLSWARVLGLTLYVPEKAVDETLYLLKPDPDEPSVLVKVAIDLAPCFASGRIHRCTIQGPAETELFVRLAARLDDAEAECLAIAKTRGWMLATDDRPARRLAAELAVELLSTPEIVKAWADKTGVADELLAGLSSGSLKLTPDSRQERIRPSIPGG